MFTSWNELEDDALMYLPLLARVLYLQGLKRFMDYDTGIVGLRRRISRQGLLETLEVHRERGSTLPPERPTVKALRVALGQLERAGLIEPVERDDRMAPLVFFLPLASIRKNAGGPDNGPFRPNEEGPRKGRAGGAEEYGEVLRSSVEGGAEEGPGRRGRHQYINTTVPYRTTHARVDTDVPGKPMDWVSRVMDMRGFKPHVAKTVSTMGMFRQWCDWGVSVGEFGVAVEAAEAKLGRVPDSPMYYRNFVEQVVRERNGGDRETGGSTGKSGRKLSPGERLAEQERQLG